uniref:Uncharacterized protein n=1 Tax=Parascaris equorum TaxID=6256 RepID=A0A914S106_PAREQ
MPASVPQKLVNKSSRSLSHRKCKQLHTEGRTRRTEDGKEGENGHHRRYI